MIARSKAFSGFVSLMISTAITAAAGAHDGRKHQSGQATSQLGDTIRTVKSVSIPPVVLQRDDLADARLSDELNHVGPIFLNFVYTSCTSVCPVMSETFADLQSRVRETGEDVHLLSISIDPDYDTPARLADYRAHLGATANWRFYSGTREASAAVQTAFGVFSRDKMNHPVATFYRAASNRDWVRIDGFASSADLENELRASSNPKLTK